MRGRSLSAVQGQDRSRVGRTYPVQVNSESDPGSAFSAKSRSFGRSPLFRKFYSLSSPGTRSDHSS
jgi:hypothetical protein